MSISELQKNAIGALFAGLAFIPAQPAFAESAAVSQKTVSANPLDEAIFQAENQAEAFANKTDGVGIVILYGEAPDQVPLEDLKSSLKAAFAKGGVKAEIFVVNDNSPGFSSSYHLKGGVAIGPISPPDTGKKVQEALRLIEGRKRVLSEPSL